MQAQGVLFGQIAAVFGIVIAGVWGATQWTAAALGYQLRLGAPWFDFHGTPVYYPWKLFHRHVGVALAPGAQSDDLWLGPLGRCRRHSQGRADAARRRLSRPA